MLEVESISKIYYSNGQSVTALRSISFMMDKPEILGIMGKSGAGKTTLLKIIAGLITPSSGTVKLNGDLIQKPTRKIGMVFQDYVAFPWLTVEKNIEFGLKINKVPLHKIRSTLEQMLSVTNLTVQRNMYPYTLSGGQRQRLALARALAIDPAVLLMDEPFSALDDDTKTQMYDYVKSIWQSRPFKMIFVTHSKAQADKICQRIIYIN